MKMNDKKRMIDKLTEALVDDPGGNVARTKERKWYLRFSNTGRQTMDAAKNAEQQKAIDAEVKRIGIDNALVRTEVGKKIKVPETINTSAMHKASMEFKAKQGDINAKKKARVLLGIPEPKLKPNTTDSVAKAPEKVMVKSSQPKNWMQSSLTDLVKRGATATGKAATAVGKYALAHPTQATAALGMGLGALAYKKYLDKKKKEREGVYV